MVPTLLLNPCKCTLCPLAFAFNSVILTGRQQLRNATASVPLILKLRRLALAMLGGWSGVLTGCALLLLAAALIGSLIAAGQFGNDVSLRCRPSLPLTSPFAAAGDFFFGLRFNLSPMQQVVRLQLPLSPCSTASDRAASHPVPFRFFSWAFAHTP